MPDYFLNAAGKLAAQTIGIIIAESDEVMEKEQPDAILILGDANSCLSHFHSKFYYGYCVSENIDRNK